MKEAKDIIKNKFFKFVEISMNERLARIRESERKSHTEMYTNQKLYNTDSWLQKPIKTVRELSTYFDEYDDLRVLDLGCGVGRNSIYIAEKFRNISCIIDCVDLLAIAIEKLLENAKEHNLSSSINGINKAIEEYEIQQNAYDFIMAISALEHIDTQDSFVRKLIEIKRGLCEKGIVCLVVNSNVMEMNLETKEPMEAQFEINLPTERIQTFLNEIFDGWEILKTSVIEQEYDIPRESCMSHLKTNVVTFVARKPK